MSASRNLYSVLGVAPDAPLTVIKAAFRALAKQYHPDGEGAGREDATRKFVELQEAYSVLSDADRRAAYDASLSTTSASEPDSIDEEDVSASIDPDEVWTSKVALQPAINYFYETLTSFSAALGNRFRLAVINGECDENPGQFAAELENSFFVKYFSEDPQIHILARRLLAAHNRKAAKALNKAVQQGKFKSAESYVRTYSVFERLCTVDRRSGETQTKNQPRSNNGSQGQANRSFGSPSPYNSRAKRIGIGVVVAIILLTTPLALLHFAESYQKVKGETASSSKKLEDSERDVTPNETQRRKQIYDRIDGEQEVKGQDTDQSDQDQGDSTASRFAGDASAVSIKNLCSGALNDERDGWDNRSPVYVSEAAKRGLSINRCRTELNLRSLEAERLQNAETTAEKPYEGDAKNVSDTNLCSGALNDEGDGWDNRSPVYVLEAARRGLAVDSCRVKLELVPGQVARSAIYLRSYASSTICPSALNLYRTGWSDEVERQKFVSEALRRRLTPQDCLREMEPITRSSAQKEGVEEIPPLLVPERDLENGNIYPEITTEDLPYSENDTANIKADIDLTATNDGNTTIPKQLMPGSVVEDFQLPVGEMLSSALTVRGVSPDTTEALVDEIGRVFPLTNLNVGAEIRLTLDRKIDFDGREVTFPKLLFIAMPDDVIVTVRADGDSKFSSVKLEIGTQSDESLRELNDSSEAEGVIIQAENADGETTKLTIPVGITSENFATVINNEEQISGSNIPTPKEGAILPGTYTYERDITKLDLIDHMIVAHDALLEKMWSKRKPNPAIPTMEHALILASLVDAETSILQEKPLVASVLINRLNKGMRLQLDSSVVYGIVGGKGTLGRALTRADINIPTPYNTYLINGLPKGPVGNPGVAAFAAVLASPSNELMYFVGTRVAGHVFAKTLDEHNSNVARWRAQNMQQSTSTTKTNEEQKDQVKLDVKNLEELLNSDSDGGQNSQSLSSGTIAEFVQSVRKCWIIPKGAWERKATAKILVKFNIDGSVTGSPEILSGDKEVGRSAVTAIVKCQKYKVFPRDQYQLWREVILNFDPNKTMDSANVEPGSGGEGVSSPPKAKVDHDKSSGRRVALVIGNAAYRRIPWLENPDDDALAMSKALSDLGFEVTTVTDASLSEMRLSVIEFGKALDQNISTALFYFSGHAIEVNSNNYLLPTDIAGQNKDGIPANAMALGELIAVFDEHSIANKIIILDACRNNPLSESRGGLALVRAGSGTFIAYSTEPGTVAVDGDAKARNSPYTAALVAALQAPLGSIEETFKEVRANVMRATNGRQIPWESSSLTADFSFSKPAPGKSLRSEGGDDQPGTSPSESSSGEPL